MIIPFRVVYDNSPHVNVSIACAHYCFGILTINSSKAPFPTGEAWEHVQSLYQNPLASCLYGKNNVELQPVSVMRIHNCTYVFVKQHCFIGLYVAIVLFC